MGGGLCKGSKQKVVVYTKRKCTGNSRQKDEIEIEPSMDTTKDSSGRN